MKDLQKFYDDVIDEPSGVNLGREEGTALYKLLLIDRWDDLSDEERKDYVRDLVRIQYSRIGVLQLNSLYDELQQTQIYQDTNLDQLFDTKN